jgi:hypothetical protein
MCYVQVKACLVIKQPKFGIYTGFSVPLLIQCVKSIDKKKGNVRWFSCSCPSREMLFGVNLFGVTNYSSSEDLLHCKLHIQKINITQQYVETKT